MNQNLNHYKIFFEVAKTGNISKAAENLYISQPAVSKSITKLEQSLSHALFIRSKKGVRLTDEGKTLYEHLEKAFDSIETAEKKLQQISELGIGQLRIGASTSLCKHILLPYLQDYIEQNPHVKISIDCKPTYETLNQLAADKIDIGLICETELDKGYHFTPIRSIHDTFVATKTYLNNLIIREISIPNRLTDAASLNILDTPSSESTGTNFSDIFDTPTSNVNQVEHTNMPPNISGLIVFSEPIATVDDYLTLSEKEILEKSNLMLLDRGNISRIYIDNYMKNHDIHASQIFEINNMDLLIDFAAIGMGVACVVREFVTDYLASGQVTELPMDYEIPPRTIGFVYKESAISTTTKNFINTCKKYEHDI